MIQRHEDYPLASELLALCYQAITFAVGIFPVDIKSPTKDPYNYWGATRFPRFPKALRYSNIEDRQSSGVSGSTGRISAGVKGVTAPVVGHLGNAWDR